MVAHRSHFSVQITFLMDFGFLSDLLSTALVIFKVKTPKPLQTQLWAAKSKWRMCFPMSGTYDSNHYYLLLKKRKRRLFGCCFSVFHQNPLLRCGSVCAALISHCFPGAGLGAVAPMEPYLVLCKHKVPGRREGARGLIAASLVSPKQWDVCAGQAIIPSPPDISVAGSGPTPSRGPGQHSCQNSHQHPLPSPWHRACCSARTQRYLKSFSLLLHHWGHLTRPKQQTNKSSQLLCDVDKRWVFPAFYRFESEAKRYHYNFGCPLYSDLLHYTILYSNSWLKHSFLECSCKSLPVGISVASTNCTPNTKNSTHKEEKHNLWPTVKNFI